MTKLQKIQLQQSEVRSQLAEELDKSEEERTEGLLENLTAQAKRLEVEYRAALTLHEESAQPDRVDTPEGRELNELRSRVNFGEYVAAALSGRGIIAGPELEYNRHLNIREDYFPLDLLALDLPETRAARDGDAQANQQTWVDRVFQPSAATALGVTFRSVDPGVAAVPVTTAGGAPVQRGRTEAVDESTYTVAVTELKPARCAVHGVYSIEDDLRLPGLQDAIRRDMRASMTERIDRIVFVGDAGANENSADIVGLNTAAGIAESELTQTDKASGQAVLETFVNLVDGQYAAMLSDLSVVCAVGAWRLWSSTVFNSTAENETVSSFLAESGLMMQTRGGIETETAENDFAAFVGLQRGIDGAAISAVWQAAQLIRDPYSGSKSGEVQLTLNAYWQLAFPRAANFKRIKFVA